MSTDPFELVDAITRKEQELHELRRELACLHRRSSLPSTEFVALRCRLHGYAVALIAQELHEVVRMAELLVLPDSPTWLMGLLALGPRRIPVLDLLARDAGVRRSPAPNEFVVIAETEAGPCGLLMEAIEGLVTVAPSQISRPERDAPFGAHVLGIVSIGDEAVLLLSAAPATLENVGLAGTA